jgi:hypothetical protein
MKTSFVIPALCMAVLALLITGCISSPQGGAVPTTTPPIAATPPPTMSSGCGFTSCNGLDLACSTNPPQVCPLYYQLGDRCRQYAFCSNTNGTCQLVTTRQFETCKTCIGKCGGADPAEIFSCEEKC